MRIAKKLVKTTPISRFASDLPSLTSNAVSVDPSGKCIIFGPLWEEVVAGGKPFAVPICLNLFSLTQLQFYS